MSDIEKGAEGNVLDFALDVLVEIDSIIEYLHKV